MVRPMRKIILSTVYNQDLSVPFHYYLTIVFRLDIGVSTYKLEDTLIDINGLKFLLMWR